LAKGKFRFSLNVDDDPRFITPDWESGRLARSAYSSRNTDQIDLTGRTAAIGEKANRYVCARPDKWRSIQSPGEMVQSIPGSLHPLDVRALYVGTPPANRNLTSAT
jgi:hypothetical protein